MTLLVDRPAAERLARNGWRLVRMFRGLYLMARP